jgi:hypothetical protein
VAVVLAGCGGGAKPTAHGSASTTTAASAKTATSASGKSGGAPRGSGLTPVPTPPGFGSPKIPTPRPTGTAPDPNAVKVIEAWSSALRHGDVRTAALYFGRPSELINGGNGNGGIALRIESFDQAEAANETLPCGAKLVSADQRGRYTNALFRLTGRPGPGGSDCGGGVGSTARTNFLVEHGRIVEWIRAPDDPGDNGTPGTSSAAPVV